MDRLRLHQHHQIQFIVGAPRTYATLSRRRPVISTSLSFDLDLLVCQVRCSLRSTHGLEHRVICCNVHRLCRSQTRNPPNTSGEQTDYVGGRLYKIRICWSHMICGRDCMSRLIAARNQETRIMTSYIIEYAKME